MFPIPQKNEYGFNLGGEFSAGAAGIGLAVKVDMAGTMKLCVTASSSSTSIELTACSTFDVYMEYNIFGIKDILFKDPGAQQCEPIYSTSIPI